MLILPFVHGELGCEVYCIHMAALTLGRSRVYGRLLEKKTLCGFASGRTTINKRENPQEA